MSETVTDPDTGGAEAPFEEPGTPSDPGEEQVVESEPGEAEEPAEEPAAQVPPGPSMEEIEKVLAKLETSANTWRRRVNELLGDEAANLVPCELCDPSIPGFHWPAELLQPTSDLHAHLLEVLKTPGEPEYLDDPNTRECGVCGGLGKTKTRGKVAGKKTRVCKTCKGFGFLDMSTGGAPADNGQATESEFELPDTGPLVTEDTDVWGSPRILDDGQENPNYGKMPQYKDKSLP